MNHLEINSPISEPTMNARSIKAHTWDDNFSNKFNKKNEENGRYSEALIKWNWNDEYSNDRTDHASQSLSPNPGCVYSAVFKAYSIPIWLSKANG